MKSDGAQLALFSMNHRVGAAFLAMAKKQQGPQIPASVPHEIPASALARASLAGDFQLAPAAAPAGSAVRATNKQLPVTFASDSVVTPPTLPHDCSDSHAVASSRPSCR
jgi:hypothetical protein